MTQQTVTVGNGDSWASLAGQLTGSQRDFLQLATQNGGLERELHPGETLTWDDSQAQKDPLITNQQWADTPTGNDRNTGQQQFGNQAAVHNLLPDMSNSTGQPHTTITTVPGDGHIYQTNPYPDPYDQSGYAQHILTNNSTGQQTTANLHQDQAAALKQNLGVDVHPVHPLALQPATDPADQSQSFYNPYRITHDVPGDTHGYDRPTQPLYTPEFDSVSEGLKPYVWQFYLSDYGNWYARQATMDNMASNIFDNATKLFAPLVKK